MVTFILICLFIELTPGPNMAYLTLLSLGAGRRAGIAAVAGVGLGLFLIGLIAAFGITAIIYDYPAVYEAIRWTGVGYLLWLAACSWRENIEVSPGKVNIAEYHLRYFRRGLMTNILNPKAAVFYATVLPNFVESTGHILPQTLVLITLSVGIATIIHLLIVLLADNLRPFLDRAGSQRLVRRALSVLLGVVAVWFGISTRP